MKIILKYAHLQKSERMDAQIENALQTLAADIHIDEAEVLVEGRPESSPPFHVRVRLTVPGPDICADASDYTPHTTFARVMKQLGERLADRTAKKHHHEKELRSLVHSHHGGSA